MCAPAAGQTAQRAAAERGGALPSYTAGSFVPRPIGSRYTSSGEHDQLRQVCRARGPPLVPRHLYGIAQHAGGIVKRLWQPTLHWATQTDGCVHQCCRGPAATAAGGTQADSGRSCGYQGGWGQSQHRDQAVPTCRITDACGRVMSHVHARGLPPAHCENSGCRTRNLTSQHACTLHPGARPSWAISAGANHRRCGRAAFLRPRH